MIIREPPLYTTFLSECLIASDTARLGAYLYLLYTVTSQDGPGELRLRPLLPILGYGTYQREGRCEREGGGGGHSKHRPQ